MPQNRGVAEAATLPPVGDQLFTLLPSSATGVHFENRLVETRDFNVFTYRNFYNGGGVGDRRPHWRWSARDRADLEPGRAAGSISTRGISTFATSPRRRPHEPRRIPGPPASTIADVNGDGLLDIYICNAGPGDAASRAQRALDQPGAEQGRRPHLQGDGAASTASPTRVLDAGRLLRLRPRRRSRSVRASTTRRARPTASAIATRATCATSTAARSSIATTAATSPT